MGCGCTNACAWLEVGLVAEEDDEMEVLVLVLVLVALLVLVPRLRMSSMEKPAGLKPRLAAAAEKFMPVLCAFQRQPLSGSFYLSSTH